VIETGRLLLREWRDEDREPFARVNAEPEVNRFLGIAGTREESDAGIERQRAMLAAHRHCFWAMERKEDGAFLGFCGLRTGVPGTPIALDVEIGWRLGSAFWGKGYAREAAAACFGWAFAELKVPRVVSITVPANSRSWGLMERLGMTRRPDMDFLHPALREGHPLRSHITYVKDRP
jgi:RimJ/RimL family protein N-acetyltransferase